MAEKNIGALPVLEDNKLVGIFSERDYARNISFKHESTEKCTVRKIMTKDVLGVKPENTTQQCIACP